MNRDASPSRDAQQVVQDLLARGGLHGETRDPEVAAGALQTACSRAFENLCDSMGEAGSNALLTRALARTELEHPPLELIHRLDGNVIRLDGVAASIDAHGLPATTAAVEALLAALIDVLGRLIGVEMAIRLIDHDARQPTAKHKGGAP